MGSCFLTAHSVILDKNDLQTIHALEQTLAKVLLIPTVLHNTTVFFDFFFHQKSYTKKKKNQKKKKTKTLV